MQKALSRQGMDLGFWRVALRPGKPLMHGRLGSTLLLGLPGNPVSSLVCAILFLVPAIRALLGDQRAADDPTEDAHSGRRPARRTGSGRTTCAPRLPSRTYLLSLAKGTERVMLPVATPHLCRTHPC